MCVGIFNMYKFVCVQPVVWVCVIGFVVFCVLTTTIKMIDRLMERNNMDRERKRERERETFRYIYVKMR